MNTNVGTPWAAVGANSGSVALPLKAAAAGALVPSSLRIPVTPGNRAYLRSRRRAELAAWQPVLEARQDALARASLRSEVSQLTREFRKESLTYGVLACVSAGAVGYAVWNSFHILENWSVVLKHWLA